MYWTLTVLLVFWRTTHIKSFMSSISKKSFLRNLLLKTKQVSRNMIIFTTVLLLFFNTCGNRILNYLSMSGLACIPQWNAVQSCGRFTEVIISKVFFAFSFTPQCFFSMFKTLVKILYAHCVINSKSISSLLSMNKIKYIMVIILSGVLIL